MKETKQKTIDRLLVEIGANVGAIDKAHKLATENYEAGEKWRKESERLDKKLEARQNEIDDLKERLFNAEKENARMRGYVCRVQEDDQVREDLITAGEPGGQEQLVPKRPMTLFIEPDHMSVGRDRGVMGYDRSSGQPSKHWIRYGR